jgi:L-ascorbate metabolism protein UlaG (beta-lactamase superfamily)
MASGSLTWLGHASFRIDTPGGKRVYVDPWLEGNPRCPASELEPEGCDVVAVTHAHFDHVASAVELGKRFQPRLVAMVELAAWLEKQGFPGASAGGMNKGGTAVVDGLRFTLVNAFHSSATPDGVYAGEPAGIVLELENGLRLYHAGDTCVFGDMQLIGRIYRPDVAILPIGDHYTMGPREASVALELLGVTRCVPCHYGTFPLLTGTPAQLRELAPDVDVLELEPGQSLEL